MKRRDFIKYAGLTAGAASFPFKGFGINPMPRLPFLSALAAGGNPNGRVLVLIQLTGGNDGINTFIPVDQYDHLNLHRGSILIPENQVLALSGVDNAGFHPAMPQFREMFDNGLVSVVQNVGYPNQDYSHFRSTDIWMSASDSDQYLSTGWLGRYLQSEYPDYPNGYPNPDMPDPLAIQIGALSSLALMGDPNPMGFAITDPQSFYQFISDLVEPAPNTPYGDELEFIRLITNQAQVYYDAIKNAADAGDNLSSLYPDPDINPLADQLKIVARLISGGLKTPIYIVSIDGFDTHAEQVMAGDPLNGLHAVLLSQVSEAIGAFQNDLELLGVADKVAGMTFSEFGRTIASNASMGTDHGAAAPLFVFGKNVIPGIIGGNAQIPNQLDESADIPMQHDFRSVYASALKDWFGINNPESILQYEFPILPIFTAPSSGVHNINNESASTVALFPNPVQQSATVRFELAVASQVTITILDVNGRPLRTVVNNNFFPAGQHDVTLDRGNLPAGQYFYQVRTNGGAVTKQMVVI
ncbi:MAG: DUF1501 domain-containing protein [Saprospiraceae bacterium]|nr:DUF1501 domain-containing protein [Saprospiraceae bacterium]